MDVCEKLHDCDMEDNLTTGGETFDPQEEINLREGVQKYVNGLIENAVKIVEMEKKERDNEESVRIFYAGLIEDVSTSLTEQWTYTEALVQDNIMHRRQMEALSNSEEEEGRRKLKDLSPAMMPTLPVTTTMVPGGPGSIMTPGTLQKVLDGSSTMTEQVTSRMFADKATEYPINDHELKDKNRKSRRFRLFKKRKTLTTNGIPKGKSNEQDPKDTGLPVRKNIRKCGRKESRSDKGIQDALMSALPVCAIIVPRAVTNSIPESSVKETLAGLTPDNITMVPPTEREITPGVMNQGENDEPDLGEILVRTEHEEKMRTKSKRSTRLGRFLKTVFRRKTEVTHTLEKDLEAVSGEIKNQSVMQNSYTATNVVEDSDDFHKTDLNQNQITCTQKLKERLRHLVCNKH